LGLLRYIIPLCFVFGGVSQIWASFNELAVVGGTAPIHLWLGIGLSTAGVVWIGALLVRGRPRTVETVCPNCGAPAVRTVSERTTRVRCPRCRARYELEEEA
jgi:DNA-directed RNA polymerase subunit RPC12/RpoP